MLIEEDFVVCRDLVEFDATEEEDLTLRTSSLFMLLTAAL